MKFLVYNGNGGNITIRRLDDIITIEEQIKAAMLHGKVTSKEVSEKLGMSQPSFTKRLKTGKFTKEELHDIANAIGCEYISEFRFTDGYKF